MSEVPLYKNTTVSPDVSKYKNTPPSPRTTLGPLRNAFSRLLWVTGLLCSRSPYKWS